MQGVWGKEALVSMGSTGLYARSVGDGASCEHGKHRTVCKECGGRSLM